VSGAALRLATAVLAFGMAVPGFAQAPAPQLAVPAPTPARTQAAAFALTQGLIHGKIAERCKGLPEPMRGQAEAALKDWQARNRRLVDASFVWFTSIVTAAANAAPDEAARTRAKNALGEQFQSFDKDAARVAASAVPGQPPQPAACERALAQFADISLDLKRSPYAPSLRELRDYARELGTASQP
jgi:hypothetical protein